MPKDNGFCNKTLKLRGELVQLDEPKVIGILNVTPDSFYDGGRYLAEDALLDQVEKMHNQGAFMIDIGGYSSRPGAEEISAQEEMDRVLHAIALIVKKFPNIFLSIDTFRADVAKAAIHAGACLVNDISGGTLDPKMFETVAELQCPYVLMHMRGTPKTMSKLTEYDNILNEMAQFFSKQLNTLHSLGVSDVILDPGFGFAKSLEQNYEILKNLGYFEQLGYPVLVGLSRKSMIYKPLGLSQDQALNATTAAHTVALMNGALFLRVHDVAEAIETIDIFKLATH